MTSAYLLLRIRTNVHWIHSNLHQENHWKLICASNRMSCLGLHKRSTVFSEIEKRKKNDNDLHLINSQQRKRVPCPKRFDFSSLKNEIACKELISDRTSLPPFHTKTVDLNKRMQKFAKIKMFNYSPCGTSLHTILTTKRVSSTFATCNNDRSNFIKLISWASEKSAAVLWSGTKISHNIVLKNKKVTGTIYNFLYFSSNHMINGDVTPLDLWIIF